LENRHLKYPKSQGSRRFGEKVCEFARAIKEHNQDLRPFIWKADPDQIIASVRRGHQTLEPIHNRAVPAIVFEIITCRRIIGEPLEELVEANGFRFLAYEPQIAENIVQV